MGDVVEPAVDAKPSKSKTLSAPVFDADLPFATVHGMYGVSYAQGGAFFDSQGNFVSKEK